MIIFISEGRLGNQIFQSMFLQRISKVDERIVVFGFDELARVFDCRRFTTFSKNKKSNRIFLKIIKSIIYSLQKLNLITFIYPEKHYFKQYSMEMDKYKVKEGFIGTLKLVGQGTFHSENFFSKNDVDNLHIHERLSRESRDLISKYPQSKKNIFVHIRLGDYKNYTVFGKNPILDISYYKKCMRTYFVNENTNFIIFSDEIKLVKEELREFDNVFFSENNAFELDFVIMTMCDGAILSPSSFGWWGAYLMALKSDIYAPKHWLGFHSGIDYPCNPMPNFFKRIKINNV